MGSPLYCQCSDTASIAYQAEQVQQEEMRDNLPAQTRHASQTEGPTFQPGTFPMYPSQVTMVFTSSGTLSEHSFGMQDVSRLGGELNTGHVSKDQFTKQKGVDCFLLLLLQETSYSTLQQQTGQEVFLYGFFLYIVQKIGCQNDLSNGMCMVSQQTGRAWFS